MTRKTDEEKMQMWSTSLGCTWVLFWIIAVLGIAFVLFLLIKEMIRLGG